MVIAFVVLVLIIVIAFISVQNERDKPSNRGKIGESQVSRVLDSLPEEYTVVNDVTIPDQKGISDTTYTTQIDHVVVSPYGIFVVETKNYSGWIFGSENSKRWKETFKTTEGHFFYNPIKQNWGHIYALAERLRLDVRLFKPVVAFSDNCELHVESTTPVVFISELKETILSYSQEVITTENVALISNRLREISLVGTEIESEHIESIGERFVEKNMIISQRKCPRCGGNLVLRNGKYGQFYGCSNYPYCRFTHKE